MDVVEEIEQAERLPIAVAYSAPIFNTADGKVVYNRLDSHLSIAACRYAGRAIARVTTDDRFYIVREVEFEHYIGKSIVVETRPGDNIVWARRPRRIGFGRCVTNRRAVWTDKFTVILKKREEMDNAYVLITGWFGAASAPEPEDVDRIVGRKLRNFKEAKRQASEQFWANHAFVLRPHPELSVLIVHGTEITYNPYTPEGRLRLQLEEAARRAALEAEEDEDHREGWPRGPQFPMTGTPV